MTNEEFFAIKNHEIDRRWREVLQITSSMSPSNTPSTKLTTISTTHDNYPLKHKTKISNKETPLTYYYTPRNKTTPKATTATTNYTTNPDTIQFDRICNIVDDDVPTSPQRSVSSPSPGFQRQDYDKYYDGYRDGLKDHPLNDLPIDNIEFVHFYAPPEPLEENNNHDNSHNNTYDGCYDNDIDDGHDGYDCAEDMGLYPNCGDY